MESQRLNSRTDQCVHNSRTDQCLHNSNAASVGVICMALLDGLVGSLQRRPGRLCQSQSWLHALRLPK